MKLVSFIVQCVVLSLLFSCHPQDQFVEIGISDGEVFYINKLAALRVEASMLVHSFRITANKQGDVIAAGEIFDGEGGFDFLPTALVEDILITIEGLDKSEAVIATNVYKIHVVEEPQVEILSPRDGDVVNISEEFFLSGSFDIAVDHVEVYIDGSMIYQTTESSFEQPYSFDRGDGIKLITFLFKDNRERVIKQINKIIELGR